jgi:hypothetical protein
MLIVGLVVALAVVGSGPPGPDEIVVRIPSGEYPLGSQIKTPKHGVVEFLVGLIPGFVVFGQAPTDNEVHIAGSVGTGIRVSRQPPNGEVEWQDANDPWNDHWVDFAIGADNRVHVRINDPGPPNARYRYTLHVSEGIALVGTSPWGVSWAEQKLHKRPTATKGTATLDAYATKLRKTFGEGSGVYWDFARAQAKVEARWLNDKASDTEADKAVSDHRASLDAGSPAEGLYLLSVIQGQALTPQLIDAARKELGLSIARSYAEAQRLDKGRAGLGPFPWQLALFGLVADEGPTEFEEAISIYKWATSDLSGPSIRIIHQKSWTSGTVTYTETELEYTWYAIELQHLQAEVVRTWKGLSAANGAMPAAQRLFQALTQASKVPGAEHFALAYRVDMRECKTAPKTTPDGFPRDHLWFWGKLLEKHPQLFSKENRGRIMRGRSPRVDETWVKWVPGHAKFMGQRLDHHHLGRGPIATPVPAGARKKYRDLLETDEVED